MDKEIKDKWVAALRSGKYTQATSVLHDEKTGGYCCLGILCEVVKPSQWDGTYFSQTEGRSSLTSVPDINWLASLGIPAEEVDVLWTRNDSGKSFPEIADYIEANL